MILALLQQSVEGLRLANFNGHLVIFVSQHKSNGQFVPTHVMHTPTKSKLAMYLLLLACCCLYVAHAELLNRRLLEGESGFELTKNLLHYELHDFSQHTSTRRALQAAGEDKKQLEYEFEVFGRRVLLDLERHDSLFAPGYAHYHIGEHGQIIKQEEALTCIYRGKIRGNDDSAVLGATVSLCGGQVRANVVLQDDSFSIQPLGNDGNSALHVAYRHLDQIDHGRKCGNTEHDHFSAPTATVSDDHGHRRRVLQPINYNKVIGLSIVNDHQRYLQYGKNVHQHASSLANVVNELFERLGTVRFPSDYKLTVQIVSMYTFTMGDPWSHAADGPCESSNCNSALVDSNGEVNATRTLYSFNTWRTTNLRPLQTSVTGHDVGHLLTGYTYQGSTIGLASTGAACTGSRTSITQASALTDAQIASTMTHEIGHNLGVYHTNDPPAGIASCGESANSTFIMSASSLFAYTNWEVCTPVHLKNFFEGNTYGNNKCMEAADSSVVFDGNPVCGDGLVEGDEECDCINGQCDTVDPCCNGATCRLLSTSTCSAQDGCCNSCQIITNTSHVCRSAVSECDFEEKCDGISKSCPFDTFKPTGEVCTTDLVGATGTCYHKQCKDANEECKVLGLAQSLAENQWDQSCRSETSSDGNNDCVVSCKQSSCSSVFGGCCKYFTSSVVTYSNGVQCDTGKACLEGECVPFTEIPVPNNPNCSNAVFDGTETDLDCGGLGCFGCAAGKFCLLDKDCLFPGLCNMTVTYENPRNGQQGYGLCSRAGRNSGNDDILDQVLDWFQANVIIWAPIVGGVVFILAVLCCCPMKYICPCCVKSNGGRNVATAGVLKAQNSFRDFRGNNNDGGRGLPVAHQV